MSFFKPSFLAVFCTASLILLNSFAVAENFSYKYIEGGLNNVDGVEPTGYTLGGAYSITKDVYIIGNGTLFDDKNINMKVLNIGAGYHLPLPTISNETDGFGDISFIRNMAGESANGFNLRVGLRHKFTKELEANGFIQHTKITDFDVSDTEIVLGARYYFIDKVSLGIQTEALEDWFFSARLDF